MPEAKPETTINQSQSTWIKWAIIILALTLGIMVVIYLVFFSTQSNQSLTQPFNVERYPSYQPPALQERQSVELAEEITDWFLDYRSGSHAISGSVRCDVTKQECEPQPLAHRRNIPLLWARNELYRKTNSTSQLVALQDETENLIKYIDVSKKMDGYARIWQTDYYHCLLIDQILATNPDLGNTTFEQLRSICIDSENEGETGYADDQLSEKIRSFYDPDQSSYDWQSDPVVLLYEGWAAEDSTWQATPGILKKNVRLLAEAAAQYKYNPDALEPQGIDGYLATALTSYHLLRENPNEVAYELYLMDQSLLLGLLQYQTVSSNYSEEISALIDWIKAVRLVPTKAEIRYDLFEYDDLAAIGNLCFLEKMTGDPHNLIPIISEVLLEYDESQASLFSSSENQPFFTHSDGSQNLYFNLAENSMLAGCLSLNQP